MIPFAIRILLVTIFCFSFIGKSFSGEPAIVLSKFEQGPIGKKLSYFQEADKKLEIKDVIRHFNTATTSAVTNDSLSLGLGVEPVWLKTSVLNAHGDDRSYRLAIETPWLDYIDTYLVYQGEVVQHIQGGDGFAYEDRPMPYRYYAFNTSFAQGQTDIYIRVQTVGPMAIPVHLMEENQAKARDIRFGYEYGFLYGIIISLVLYNLVLYTIIRRPEYGLYSLYLFGFVVNSLSYTGQLHTVFTPDFGPYFQDWMDIFLMVTYSVFGLHFARVLLSTKDYAPKLERFTFWVATIIPIGMIIGAIFNNLQLSMLLAFILNTNFVFLFMALGYRALKAKVDSAMIFVVSSVTAAACICISTAAVFGLLPLNNFTFKLIEIGMAFEAVLLAALLGMRFRMVQNEKAIAESWARTDELTGLFNRRGFSDVAQQVWASLMREHRDCAILLLDIDNFKAINDSLGHAAGDHVLHQLGKTLAAAIRKSDVIARWGGEEFIILLPETNLENACHDGERIRKVVEQCQCYFEGNHIKITVSIGVAGSQNHVFNKQSLSDINLERLTIHADDALYYAKNNGRNQVKSHLEIATESP